jgi:hypothetical protein
MKTLLVSLTAVLLSATNIFATVNDEKRTNHKHRASYSEIRELFREHGNRPDVNGSVTAIVCIDAEGNAKVVEVDSDDKSLRSYVVGRIEAQTFRNLKNETIRLVVGFRN